MDGLRGVRVVDFSNRIAGAYVTKLLADAYADVIKVEPPGGDPVRRWSASHQDLAGADGALFQFLNCSKRSVVGLPDVGLPVGALVGSLVGMVAQDTATSYVPKVVSWAHAPIPI